MAKNTYKSYLTSFQVFGKTSDNDVKEALKSLVINKDRERLSSDDVADILESTRPIKKSEIGAVDYYAMLGEHMFVNNQIASKAITLADQKKITRANYEVIDVSMDINKKVAPPSNLTLAKIPMKPIQPDDFDIKEILKDLGKDIKNFIKSLVMFDMASATSPITSYMEDLKTVKNRIPEMEWHDTNASVWLANIMEQDNQFGNNFRFNFTVYRDGTSIQQKPIYGKLDPKYTADLAMKAVTKFRGYKRLNHKGFSYAETSYFDKKVGDLKVKENLATKESQPNSRNYENRVRQKRNPFIRDLLDAGPDLSQNMFDVYLRFNNTPTHESITVESDPAPVDEPTSYVFFTPVLIADKKGKATQKNSYVWDSTFKDTYSISVRTTGVTIPLMNRESTTEKFLNTTYERPGNLVSFNNEGTLSVDCDANTYVNDMFLALSGLQRDGKFKNGATSQLEDIQKDVFDRTKNQYPFMAPAKLGFQMTSVDLVVSSHGLSMFHDKWVNPGGGGFYSNVLYVFKDVRFLGVGNGIKFATENAGSQTVDAKFIFKRLETYYKPDNLPFAVTTQGVVRDSMFNGRNLNGQYYSENTIIEKENE